MTKSKGPPSVTVLGVLSALVLAGCGDNLSPVPETIADHIRLDARLSSFEGLLEDANQLETLDGAGTFTVFAPTNQAFEKLLEKPGVSRDWLALPVLADLVSYHIHEGEIGPEDLERVAAVATLEGREILVRLTLEGLVLNDGVRFEGEAITADNGVLYLLSDVLSRPLVTTTQRYESAPNRALSNGTGPVFEDDYISIESDEYIHGLRVFVEIEHPDVSRLQLYLTHYSPGDFKSISLLASVRSRRDDLSIEFADSAPLDVIDDVLKEGEGEGEAFPEAAYRPREPLEYWLGDPAAGEWELNVYDYRGESEEGAEPEAARLVRWGLTMTAGPERPEPSIVIDRRRVVSEVFGRGLSETVPVSARRVAGLTGEMELQGQAGSIEAETKVLSSDRSFGELRLPIARDAELGSVRGQVSARVGDISRVLPFDAKVVEPDARGLSLQAQVSLPELGAEGFSGNDIWGWTDPVTGAEIALMGTAIGTTFVDISEPRSPVVLGALLSATGASDWRDIKVYDDHAYIVSEAEDHGLQIFDLTQLRGITAPQSFTQTAHVDDFGNAHNIAINEDSGFGYVVGSNYPDCAGGLLIYDLATAAAPLIKGCFAGGVPLGQAAGPEYPLDVYIHDVQCVSYLGPDPDHQGKEICLSSDEQSLGIADVSDKSNPTQLSRVTYEGVGYTHQGWLTEDHHVSGIPPMQEPRMDRRPSTRGIASTGGVSGVNCPTRM